MYLTLKKLGNSFFGNELPYQIRFPTSGKRTKNYFINLKLLACLSSHPNRNGRRTWRWNSCVTHTEKWRYILETVPYKRIVKDGWWICCCFNPSPGFVVCVHNYRKRWYVFFRYDVYHISTIRWMNSHQTYRQGIVIHLQKNQLSGKWMNQKCRMRILFCFWCDEKVMNSYVYGSYDREREKKKYPA